MQIKKYYKFYAGHRNADLKDKCSRPHGHLYQMYVYFNVVRTGSITTLFSNFDDIIEPWVKSTLDHRFLMDEKDKLAETFKRHEKETGECLGAIILPFPTSVENLTHYIFDKILSFGFEVNKIEMIETTTSTLVYTKEDYINDLSVLNN